MLTTYNDYSTTDKYKTYVVITINYCDIPIVHIKVEYAINRCKKMYDTIKNPEFMAYIKTPDYYKKLLLFTIMFLKEIECWHKLKEYIV